MRYKIVKKSKKYIIGAIAFLGVAVITMGIGLYIMIHNFDGMGEDGPILSHSREYTVEVASSVYDHNTYSERYRFYGMIDGEKYVLATDDGGAVKYIQTHDTFTLKEKDTTFGVFQFITVGSDAFEVKVISNAKPE